MTFDLADTTGLPVSFDAETGGLIFAPPLPAPEPATRAPERLRAVYRHPQALDEFEDKSLYLMYDGVALPEHGRAIAEAGLRYDLTVLPHAMIGDEPIKTLGHYHTAASDGLPYPELYQVVLGCTYFVLQLAGAPDYRVEDTMVVEARAGEVVLMPPGWGHVSVNAGDAPLVMCNWIASACDTVPEPYLARGGAAWHVVCAVHGLQLVPNPRYEAPGAVTRQRGARGIPGFIAPGPIYALGVADLGALRPLVEPTAYDWGAVGF
ncbi:MAG: glucose-6-phosphate isomerase [Armatimonadota bacterium]|nr:MAG: glucose-6-phosphate isomerase [Armatimonadota bacterium]